MTTVVSFMAFKGGVGKTTSCTNFAGILAQQGKKVLLVDADFQGNATNAFGLDPDSSEGFSFYEMILEEVTFEEIVQNVHENIDLIPSSLDLCAIDRDMVEDMAKEENQRKWKGDHSLIVKNLIDNIKDTYDYDYILIDCGPALSYFSFNLIKATDKYLIPVQMSKFGYRGTIAFIGEIIAMRGTSQIDAFVFPNFYHNRHMTSQDYLQKAKVEIPKLNVTLTNTMIGKTVKYENAVSYHNMPETLRDIDSYESKQYVKLVEEVL